ncbi:MAG: hypothetical protein ACRCTA_07460 [Bacilli bacterium]
MDRFKSQNKRENDKEKVKAKSSLISKVNDGANIEVNDMMSQTKINLDMNIPSSNNSNPNEINPFVNNKGNNHRKPKKKFFFFRLSILARVMFVIYIIGFGIVGYLLVDFLGNKGTPILEGRTPPIKVLTNKQVKDIEDQINGIITNDSLSVEYIAYRLVIVIDLADDISESDAMFLNGEIYKVVNNVAPIGEYFSGNDQNLGNDVIIYSTDLVPKNADQNSRFVLETYKNSQMGEPQSYNLLTMRDEASYNKVMETYQKAAEGQ